MTPYCNYLTVDGDAVAVGAFLEVVGGDTAVATVAGETLVARGTADGSGEITLRFGAADVGGAPASAGSDAVQDYADQAAAETGGWTFTDSQSPAAAPGTSFTFDSGVSVGPFDSSLVLTTHNPGYFSGITGTVQAQRTFTVTPGQSYTVKVWAGASDGNAWYSAAALDAASGANVGHADINGSEPDQQIAASLVAGSSSLTVTLAASASNVYAVTQSWYFAGLTIEGLGGESTVTFRDIPVCVGSGIGLTGEPVRRAA